MVSPQLVKKTKCRMHPLRILMIFLVAILVELIIVLMQPLLYDSSKYYEKSSLTALESSIQMQQVAEKKRPLKKSNGGLMEQGDLVSLEPVVFDDPTVDDAPLARSVKPDGSRRCAILLFGLPRSFTTLVLPAFRKNIIQPNLQYNCDYFVHYYQVDKEDASRSGAGGTVQPDQILALRDAIDAPSVVQFISDTNQSFWKSRGDLIHKVRTATTKRRFMKPTETRPQTNLLYAPIKDLSATLPSTTDNIIKMWHSQTAAWNLMHQHEISIGSKLPYYDSVAVLRSDVVYITPIDVYSGKRVGSDQPGKSGASDELVIIPGFARFPINDRLIIGPYKAVEIWASKRFDLMDYHAKVTIQKKAPGFGIHDERFLFYTVLPKIRKELGYKVYQDNSMCFLRARADQTIWGNDCYVSQAANTTSMIQAVEINRLLVQNLLFDDESTTDNRCRVSWLDPSIKKRVIKFECIGENSKLPDDFETGSPSW